MGLFDFFRKKADSVTNESPSTSNNEQFIDDVTFIRAIKHITATPWHQYDILLAVRGYG